MEDSEDEIAYRRHIGGSSDSSEESDSYASDESCDGKPPPQVFTKIIKIPAKRTPSDTSDEDIGNSFANDSVKDIVDYNANQTKNVNIQRKIQKQKNVNNNSQFPQSLWGTSHQQKPNQMPPKSNLKQSVGVTKNLADTKISTLLQLRDFGILPHYFVGQNSGLIDAKANADLITISNVPQFGKPVTFINKKQVNKTKLESILQKNTSTNSKTTFATLDHIFGPTVQRNMDSKAVPTTSVPSKPKTWASLLSETSSTSKLPTIDLTPQINPEFIPTSSSKAKTTLAASSKSAGSSKLKKNHNAQSHQTVGNAVRNFKMIDFLPPELLPEVEAYEDIGDQPECVETSSKKRRGRRSEKSLRDRQERNKERQERKKERQERKKERQERYKERQERKETNVLGKKSTFGGVEIEKLSSPLEKLKVDNHWGIENDNTGSFKLLSMSSSNSNTNKTLNHTSNIELAKMEWPSINENRSTYSKEKKVSNVGKVEKLSPNLGKLVTNHDWNISNGEDSSDVCQQTTNTVINKSVVPENEDVINNEIKSLHEESAKDNVEKNSKSTHSILERSFVINLSENTWTNIDDNIGNNRTDLEGKIASSLVSQATSSGINESVVQENNYVGKDEVEKNTKSKYEFMDRPTTILEHSFVTELARKKWANVVDIIGNSKTDLNYVNIKKESPKDDTSVNKDSLEKNTTNKYEFMDRTATILEGSVVKLPEKKRTDVKHMEIRKTNNSEEAAIGFVEIENLPSPLHNNETDNISTELSLDIISQDNSKEIIKEVSIGVPKKKKKKNKKKVIKVEVTDTEINEENRENTKENKITRGTQTDFKISEQFRYDFAVDVKPYEFEASTSDFRSGNESAMQCNETDDVIPDKLKPVRLETAATELYNVKSILVEDTDVFEAEHLASDSLKLRTKTENRQLLENNVSASAASVNEENTSSKELDDITKSVPKNKKKKSKKKGTDSTVLQMTNNNITQPDSVIVIKSKEENEYKVEPNIDETAITPCSNDAKSTLVLDDKTSKETPSTEKLSSKLFEMETQLEIEIEHSENQLTNENVSAVKEEKRVLEELVGLSEVTKKKKRRRGKKKGADVKQLPSANEESNEDLDTKLKESFIAASNEIDYDIMEHVASCLRDARERRPDLFSTGHYPLPTRLVKYIDEHSLEINNTRDMIAFNEFMSVQMRKSRIQALNAMAEHNIVLNRSSTQQSDFNMPEYKCEPSKANEKNDVLTENEMQKDAIKKRKKKSKKKPEVPQLQTSAESIQTDNSEETKNKTEEKRKEETKITVANADSSLLRNLCDSSHTFSTANEENNILKDGESEKEVLKEENKKSEKKPDIAQLHMVNPDNNKEVRNKEETEAKITNVNADTNLSRNLCESSNSFTTIKVENDVSKDNGIQKELPKKKKKKSKKKPDGAQLQTSVESIQTDNSEETKNKTEEKRKEETKITVNNVDSSLLRNLCQSSHTFTAANEENTILKDGEPENEVLKEKNKKREKKPDIAQLHMVNPDNNKEVRNKEETEAKITNGNADTNLSRNLCESSHSLTTIKVENDVSKDNGIQKELPKKKKKKSKKKPDGAQLQTSGESIQTDYSEEARYKKEERTEETKMSDDNANSSLLRNLGQSSHTSTTANKENSMLKDGEPENEALKENKKSEKNPDDAQLHIFNENVKPDNDKEVRNIEEIEAKMIEDNADTSLSRNLCQSSHSSTTVDEENVVLGDNEVQKDIPKKKNKKRKNKPVSVKPIPADNDVDVKKKEKTETRIKEESHKPTKDLKINTTACELLELETKVENEKILENGVSELARKDFQHSSSLTSNKESSMLKEFDEIPQELSRKKKKKKNKKIIISIELQPVNENRNQLKDDEGIEIERDTETHTKEFEQFSEDFEINTSKYEIEADHTPEFESFNEDYVMSNDPEPNITERPVTELNREFMLIVEDKILTTSDFPVLNKHIKVEKKTRKMSTSEETPIPGDLKINTTPSQFLGLVTKVENEKILENGVSELTGKDSQHSSSLTSNDEIPKEVSKKKKKKNKKKIVNPIELQLINANRNQLEDDEGIKGNEKNESKTTTDTNKNLEEIKIERDTETYSKEFDQFNEEFEISTSKYEIEADHTPDFESCDEDYVMPNEPEPNTERPVTELNHEFILITGDKILTTSDFPDLNKHVKVEKKSRKASTSEETPTPGDLKINTTPSQLLGLGSKVENEKILENGVSELKGNDSQHSSSLTSNDEIPKEVSKKKIKKNKKKIVNPTELQPINENRNQLGDDEEMKGNEKNESKTTTDSNENLEEIKIEGDTEPYTKEFDQFNEEFEISSSKYEIEADHTPDFESCNEDYVMPNEPEPNITERPVTVLNHEFMLIVEDKVLTTSDFPVLNKHVKVEKKSRKASTSEETPTPGDLKINTTPSQLLGLGSKVENEKILENGVSELIGNNSQHSSTLTTNKEESSMLKEFHEIPKELSKKKKRKTKKKAIKTELQLNENRNQLKDDEGIKGIEKSETKATRDSKTETDTETYTKKFDKFNEEFEINTSKYEIEADHTPDFESCEEDVETDDVNPIESKPDMCETTVTESTDEKYMLITDDKVLTTTDFPVINKQSLKKKKKTTLNGTFTKLDSDIEKTSHQLGNLENQAENNSSIFRKNEACKTYINLLKSQISDCELPENEGKAVNTFTTINEQSVVEDLAEGNKGILKDIKHKGVTKPTELQNSKGKTVQKECLSFVNEETVSYSFETLNTVPCSSMTSSFNPLNECLARIENTSPKVLELAAKSHTFNRKLDYTISLQSNDQIDNSSVEKESGSKEHDEMPKDIARKNKKKKNKKKNQNINQLQHLNANIVQSKNEFVLVGTMKKSRNKKQKFKNQVDVDQYQCEASHITKRCSNYALSQIDPISHDGDKNMLVLDSKILTTEDFPALNKSLKLDFAIGNTTENPRRLFESDKPYSAIIKEDSSDKVSASNQLEDVRNDVIQNSITRNSYSQIVRETKSVPKCLKEENKFKEYSKTTSTDHTSKPKPSSPRKPYPGDYPHDYSLQIVQKPISRKNTLYHFLPDASFLQQSRSEEQYHDVSTPTSTVTYVNECHVDSHHQRRPSTPFYEPARQFSVNEEKSLLDDHAQQIFPAYGDELVNYLKISPSKNLRVTSTVINIEEGHFDNQDQRKPCLMRSDVQNFWLDNMSSSYSDSANQSQSNVATKASTENASKSDDDEEWDNHKWDIPEFMDDRFLHSFVGENNLSDDSETRSRSSYFSNMCNLI